MTLTIPVRKCLVVGASGFVGKVLCDQLRNKGTHVRAMVRQAQESHWDEVIVVDLENFQKQEDKIFSGIDTIYYLASIAHNKAPPSEYQKINVDLCLAFAQCAIRHGVKRFIYVSSTKADEKPMDAYGESKLRAEAGLLALQDFEHLVILRPCLIYGPGVQGNLYSMIKAIDKGWFPPLPETSAKRSMISVKDVANALIAVSENSQCNRKIYILADGHDYSVKEIENSIRLQLGKGLPHWHVPYFVFYVFGKLPITSAMMSKLFSSALHSSQKIQNDTDWKPTEHFADVLPKMIDYYRLRND